MKPDVIVALDVASQTEFDAVFSRFPKEINWFKVGLELFCAAGPPPLAVLREAKKRVFLDLKLHDIPRTVHRAVLAASRHGVELLTIHSCGGAAMLKEAANAAKIASSKGNPIKLLAVTVLTSMDENDLVTTGVHRKPAAQALALAELAFSCGIDGVVCSVHEAAALRAALGPDALIVTPGIRLPGDTAGDQKRIATPRAACDAGATHIVVGRPILEAPDPANAYRNIVNDMG